MRLIPTLMMMVLGALWSLVLVKELGKRKAARLPDDTHP